MELLLNFLWLMLAMPAFVIWRQHLSSSHGTAKVQHSRSLLLLGCLLVLLFPAVSASDDLHPISAEIEESGAFKRTVKQSPGFKAPTSTQGGDWAALPVQVASFQPEDSQVSLVLTVVPDAPQQAVVGSAHNRAPPAA